MRANIRDFVPLSKGSQILTLNLSEDFSGQYDKLKECELDVKITKFSERRSKTSNAYMWELIGQIADAVSSTKDEVYRAFVKDNGIWQDIEIEDKAVKTLSTVWADRGTAWITEVVDDSHAKEGFTVLRCYYGTSVYTQKQMSRIVDAVVEAAKEQGIETMTPDEIAEMNARWENK